MALSTGIFNANTGNPAELNARSFAGQILRRYPNGTAPMFALSSESGKSRAKASTHGYFSKTMTFLVITVVATALIGDTNFTNENIRVNTVTSGTVVAVSRAFGRVAAAAVNASDVWIQSGTAFEEGSNRPTARRLTTEYVANYTQIFRNAWALTDTARASYAEMGISNVKENKDDCAMFHATDIESAILYGQAKMDTSGATPMHSTQGVIDAIRQYAASNVNAAGSTTTFDQLVALAEPAFTTSTNLGNAKSRMAFCDNVAMRVLNSIGRKSGQIMMSTEETKFGMRYVKFEFWNGTLELVVHPLLNGLQRSGMMLIMDMPALKLAYMDGRDTIPEAYGVTPGQQGQVSDSGQDAQGGSLLSEAAVELINPYSCALITGLTAGLA